MQKHGSGHPVAFEVPKSFGEKRIEVTMHPSGSISTALSRAPGAVHVITTAEGIPVQYLVTAGSIHDNTAFQGMAISLPTGSDLYGDAAYINQEMKELLLNFEGVTLELENRCHRKRIENTFADITAKFPRTIHAVTAKGFLLKILCFIIMFILDKQF